MTAQTMDEWVQSEALLRGRPPTVRFIAPPPVEDLFCPLISVDDHVLEPPTLFDGRLPRRLAERAPAVAAGPGGLPMWVIDDRPWPVTMANGAAGRERTDWGFYCISFEETRPGVTDPTARLADMDLCGVWASLCFCSTVWGFAGTKFSTMKDPAVGLACLKAYNDWMIEEWCAAAPDRYIPCQLPWLPDPLAAAEEIRRNATRGFRAVSFSENPEGLGFPNIYSSHWEPFLAACEETGTVVNLHVGSSGTTRQPSHLLPLRRQRGPLPRQRPRSPHRLDLRRRPREVPAAAYRLIRRRSVLGANGHRTTPPRLHPRRRPQLAYGGARPRRTGTAQLRFLLYRGSLRLQSPRHHRRGQRHGRNRLPPLRLHLAPLPRNGARRTPHPPSDPDPKDRLPKRGPHLPHTRATHPLDQPLRNRPTVDEHNWAFINQLDGKVAAIASLPTLLTR